MDTWTAQAGYPLLTVTKISDTAVRITQKRFAVNTQTEIAAKRYTIPIRFRTNAMAAGESKLVWMTKDQESIDVPLGGVTTWYKFNEDQIGYYRVTYEEAMWAELAKTLSTWSADGTNVFSPLNRAHLLNDVVALADGEYLSYNIALDMMNYLKEERNLVPWSVAISQMKKLMALLDTAAVSDSLKTHFHQLSRDAYEYVKFSACSGESEDDTGAVCSEEKDPHPIQLLREKLVDLLCQLEHEDCIKNVDVHFDAYLNTNTPISPNVRQSVYYYGLKEANATIWNYMFDLLVKETDPQEVTKLMVGLSSTVSLPLVDTYINRAWGEMRSQDFFSVLANLSENPNARSMVWEWVQENWEKLVNRYTINERTLGRVIPNITRRFSTQARLNEVST